MLNFKYAVVNKIIIRLTSYSSKAKRVKQFNMISNHQTLHINRGRKFWGCGDISIILRKRIIRIMSPKMM